MKKSIGLTVAAIGLAGLLFSACSSAPSEEELKQLEQLRAEVASLEKEVAAKDAEKVALQKAVAEKDALLAKCSEERAAIEQKLKAQ